MNLELRSRLELLPTRWAHVIIAVASCVLPLNMILEILLDGEFRLADTAPEDAMFVALVSAPVPIGSERLIAQGANETSRWFMPLQVAHIVGLVEEHLVANFTGIMLSI